MGGEGFLEPGGTPCDFLWLDDRFQQGRLV